MTISKPSRWEKQGTPASFLPQSYVAQSLGLKEGSISRSNSRKLQGQRQGMPNSWKDLISREPYCREGLGPEHQQGAISSTHSPLPFLHCPPTATANGFDLRSWRNRDFHICLDLHGGTLSVWGKTHMPEGGKMWRAETCKGCLLESQRQMSKATQAR